MVSLGNTAISFHILQTGGGGVFWTVKTQSAKIKICLNFNFLGGGGELFWTVKTQGAKICLNFNFFFFFWEGGGVGVLDSQNLKCQDLPKFQFSGEGGYSGTKFQNRGVLGNLVKNFWKHVFWKPSLLVHHR